MLLCDDEDKNYKNIDELNWMKYSKSKISNIKMCDSQ